MVCMVTWGSRTNTTPANNQHWVFYLCPKTTQIKQSTFSSSLCQCALTSPLLTSTNQQNLKSPMPHFSMKCGRGGVSKLPISHEVLENSLLRAHQCSHRGNNCSVISGDQPELSTPMQTQRKPYFISSAPLKNP